MHSFWKNKKVLVTGHTGFKGSWLCLMLIYYGAKVSGISLKPKKNEYMLFQKTLLNNCKNYYINIINQKKINSLIKRIKPDLIFHLAAQPFVIEGYKNPKKTYDTNISGTLNVLEAIKKNKIKTSIIVTTDKVYKNSEKKRNFVETDQLGGDDPYSSSKHISEILVKNYNDIYFKNKNINVVTVRAGNVIGGGDRGKDRLIPDFFKTKKNLYIRSPYSTRPWQFVLDPLYGYLKLSKYIHNKKLQKDDFSWNFAPNDKYSKNVKYVITEINKNFNKKIIFKEDNKIKEKKYLNLNSGKAKKILNWKCKYSLNKSLEKIIEWEKNYKKGILQICQNQIEDYLST